MVKRTENKIIKAIKKVRELFNLMRLEIIFHEKKQKRSEKNCIKRKLSIKYYQKKTI